MVVAPGVFVEVALKPLLGHGVVDASDPVLDEREEPLDRVRVDGADDVDVLVVWDAVVSVERLSGRLVRAPLVV